MTEQQTSKPQCDVAVLARAIRVCDDAAEYDCAEHINRAAIQINGLRTALYLCLSSMEIQEKREKGEFHLAMHAFHPMWDEAKQEARKELDIPADETISPLANTTTAVAHPHHCQGGVSWLTLGMTCGICGAVYETGEP